MNRRIVILFSVSFIAMIVAYALNRRSFNDMKEYIQVVDNAQTITLTFEQVFKHLRTAQVYVKLLDNRADETASGMYVHEVDSIRTEILQLRGLITSKEQALRIDTMYRLMNRRISWELRPGNGKDRLSMVAVSAEYLFHLQEVEAVSQRALAHARAMLTERRMLLQESTADTDMWTGILNTISVIFILMTLSYMVFQVFKRTRTEDFLESVLNASLNAIISYSAIRSPHDRSIVDFRVNYAKGETDESDETERISRQTFLQRFPTALSDGQFEKMVQVVETGETQIHEMRYRQGKNFIWYKIKLVKMGDGVTSSFINITDIKESQEQLKNYVRQLEQSNAELERFAFIASHDLQEPLRKIQTFSDTLRKKENIQQDEDAAQLASRIINASERMRNLIDALLNFSRMSTMQPKFSPVDLNITVESVLKDFELMIYEKKAIVKTDKLPVIEADPLQMNQLFYNLVNNALKFHGPGAEPVVTITWETVKGSWAQKLWNLSPTYNYAKIKISDNGIGFDEKYADHIFIIFNRLHAQAVYGGSGIGLALCKKIVVNHYGEIYAEGKEGTGASFYILLPFGKQL